MACTSTFINNVIHTLKPLGIPTARKMMGDYLIYVDGKLCATACDNMLYIKQLDSRLTGLLSDAEIGRPYEGAKECFVLDLTDTELVRKAISIVISGPNMANRCKSTNKNKTNI